MTSAHILVIEDNTDLRIEIVDYLNFCNYNVAGVGSIKEMENALAQHQPDIVLLDLTLPDGNGLQAAEYLRKRLGLDIGIIMVTARGQADDRIAGITVGADAYLVKPINLRELSATIKQLYLRLNIARSNPAPSTHWSLDQQALVLCAPDGSTTSLTVTESLLIKALLENPGASVSRDDLCKFLPPGSSLDDTRRLDSIFSRLRSKVKKDTGANLPLHALRNKGYSFTETP